MIFTRECKAENELVEEWLLFYPDRLEEYKQARSDILHGSKSADVGGGGSSGPGDPTGQKGSRLGDLDVAEKWLKLIKQREEDLPKKMRVFLRLRRDHRHIDRGPKGWVPSVQLEYAAEMAKHLGKRQEDVWIESRNTFTNWWNWIVEFMARQAAKEGLI